MPQVSESEMEVFRRDGFFIRRGHIASDVLRQLQTEVEEVSRALAGADPLPSGVELARMPTGERRPARVEPVLPHVARVERLASDPSMVGLSEALIGEPVHLLEDKLIFKPPSCLDTYPPHQELWWTREYSTRNLMLVISLTRCTPENGPLFVVPGSHREGLLRHVDDEIPYEQAGLDRGVPLLMEPGDVAAVDCGTIHYSAENRSADLPRHLLLLTYNARSEGDLYRHHREKWQQFYEGEGQYLVPEHKR